MAAWSGPNSDTQGRATLPQGICNFRDLSREQAPICPCRRFYLNRSRLDSRTGPVDSAWCFCGHHACFHDHVSQFDPTPTSQAAQIRTLQASQVDDRTSIIDIASQGHISQEEGSDRPISPTQTVGLGLHNAPSQPGIWDALNAYVRDREGENSDRSSALPSTAVASVPPSQVNTSAHHFMRHVLNVQSNRIAGASAKDGLQETERLVDTASLTEINTPSVDGTPLMTRQSPAAVLRRTQSTQPTSIPAHNFGQSGGSSIRPQHSPPRRPTSSHVSPPHVARHQARNGADEPSLREMQNVVRSCAQRLDLLESLSYTHVPLDEVEDKFEHVDSRLLSLEDFRSEVEARLGSQGSEESAGSRKRRLLPAEATASFASNDSISHDTVRSSSSAVSATAAVYAKYSGRFQAMTQRIESLEQIVPTPSNPWQVEVVLLPWGRHLPGIWSPASDLGSTSAGKAPARDEWNGTNSAHDIFGDGAQARAGWSTGSIQAWADSAQDWLSPKACGPNGVVYRRLWSRGLVQTVTVTSSDAHHFMQSCKTAFAGIINTDNATGIASSSKLEYDALREPFVPLRKLRKVSRLRFLAPSEMVSSALWTPSFLEASVFMKAKGHQRRLYITFPEAYLQQAGDGWTWSVIHSLRSARRDSLKSGVSGPGFDGVEQNDFEASWNHHTTLDAPPYVSDSFHSHVSGQLVWSTKSQASQNHLHPHDGQMGDERPPSALVSPVSESRTFRELRRRTVSIPPAEATTADTPKSKRRVASFETAALAAKRRKTSMSSQPPRPGPANTPRLSREPPSPFASDYPLESRSDNASGRRVVLTPLAYETPHSHTNNAMAALYTIDRDGDTDAETEILDRHRSQDHADEEWRGIGDEQFFPPSQVGGPSRREDTVIIRGSDGDESELEE